MSEDKESLRHVCNELYNQGIVLLNKYIEISKANGITFPIINPKMSFDSWYDKLFKDITNGNPQPDKSRWNKVIQQGNFLISQPSGGFDVTVDKDTMVSEYKKAVGIETPLFMVITEPFTTSFLGEDLTLNINC